MLDSASIDIYRKFLYDDADVARPIPSRLVAIHEELFALQRKVFRRSQLSDDGHLLAYTQWKTHTAQGKEFPIETDEDDDDDNRFDWAKLPPGTKVIVDYCGQRREATLRCAKGRYQISVEIDGQLKAVRSQTAEIAPVAAS